MNTDTTGGVSPLKARQSHRGGKKAGTATSTGKRRGGYAQSRGKKGAGGPNVGGYNVATRFTPSVIRPFPGSGGTTIIDTSLKKPYIYDKDGKLVLTEYKTDEDVTTEIKEEYVGEKRDACSEWYIKTHGDAKCKEYKAYRKKNPKKKQFKTEAGKKWSRTYEVDKSGKRIKGSESEWKVVSEHSSTESE